MDYFDSFIKECIRDLKKEKRTIVFFINQVDEIKKTFPNLKVKKIDNDNFELSLQKEKVGC